MTAPRPPLSSEIRVDPSATNVEALWDRFEVFEASHHSQRICNPMTEAELDRLIEVLDPQAGQDWLDIACGSGEVLIRAHEAGVANSLGIDLSPWMLQSATRHAASRLAGPKPTWLLGDAAKVEPTSDHDVVVCLGADWIWHGMVGTIRAIAERLAARGRAAYGGPRLHLEADPKVVTKQFGVLQTIADVEEQLAAVDLRVVERIDPGDAGWLAYLERGRACTEEWAQRWPGEQSAQWQADHREWFDAFYRDQAIVGWSVWVVEA